MKLRLVAVGRLRQGFAREAASEYASRIERLVPLETVAVAASSAGADRAPAEESSRLVKSLLRKGARMVLLDERGEQSSTAELAERIQGWMNSSVDVDIVVGGAYGVEEALRGRADEVWSLSRLTLPHELARVVALEAVYRALTIVKNLPYHHK